MYPTQRFVDHDNSCLFSSIAYLLDDNFDIYSKYKYRQLLINYLEENDIDESILGMNKETYIDKMSNINTWGGGIELKFFSEIFQTEIVSIDIEFNRLDIFGGEQNYLNRIFILYNGIHYDPLVMATSNDNKDDIKIFDIDDDNIIINFQIFADKLKEKEEYVDLSNIKNIKCVDCMMVFESEEETIEHAINYNHWNFKKLI